MYFEDQIRDAIRRLDGYGYLVGALCFPAFLLIGAVIIGRDWIDWVIGAKEPSNVPEILVGALGSYMVLALFGVMGRMFYWQKKSPMKCPKCGEDLFSRLQMILVTRTCHACDKQIVTGGKVKNWEVARRYQRRKFDRVQMAMMSAFSPILPLFGTILMAWEWVTWNEQGRPLVLVSVFCIPAFAFAFFGYYNWRRWWFVLEMFFALAVGILGGWLYWNF